MHEILEEAQQKLDALLSDTRKNIRAVEPPWQDFYGNEYDPSFWQIVRAFR